MKRNLFFLSLCFFGGVSAEIMDKTALKQNYIDKWRNTAIQQMIDHKIPASITLAQGIIESASGTSRLATIGNNHFGIKCHEWDGEKMYHDDDAIGECFRVYGAPELSFLDHSQFLTTRSRYSSLFSLSTTDYKGWAKGLKKAGYATNPEYANILIRIIEEFHLDDFDASILPPRKKNAFLNSNKNRFGQLHQVEVKENKSQYIVAQKGDTYYRISQEFSMAMWELRKYNDFEMQKDVLEEGDLVYIQPKKRKSSKGKYYDTQSAYESLITVSQSLGIKLKTLERKNPIHEAHAQLSKGTKLRLK